MFLLRSYLVNKLPVLLTIFSASIMPPFTIQWCITEALGHVDPQAFPSLSQMFGPLSGSGMLSDVRQEFLFACALHDLIAEDSIEHLLGEPPMQTLPAGGRYSKEDLVSQCSVNPEKLEELVGELEGLDGNAGAIAGAVVEVRWFRQREESATKSMIDNPDSLRDERDYVLKGRFQQLVQETSGS